jgi:hypothetical protein
MGEVSKLGVFLYTSETERGKSPQAFSLALMKACG